MNFKLLLLLFKKEERPEINEVRDRFFRIIIYPFLIFGFFATIMGALQSYQQGTWIFSIIYVGCYLIVILTIMLGHRISLAIRSIILVLALMAFSITILIRIGLSGIGLEILLAACAVSSALLGRKVGLILVGVGFFAMVIIGGGMVWGMLPIREEIMLTSVSPLAWSTSIVVFCMVGLCLVTLPQMFLARLQDSLALLERDTEKLEQSNISMQRTIEICEQTANALRESEAKYRVLVENAGDAIFIAQEGILRFANKRSEELIGYTQEELYSRHFKEFIHKDDRSVVAERHIQRQQGKEIPSNYSFRIIHKSGAVKSVELNVVLIEWQGKPATLNFLRDVSERKKAEELLKDSEEKLARAKKMESLGLLAGGVAHDLNNVLSGIVSYPELLLLDLPEDSKLRKPIMTIHESGLSATAIVQDLLTVARGVAITKEPVNINSIVKDYLRSPEYSKLRQFHSRISITCELHDDLFNVRGSRLHIKKTLMNLVSNAAEAIEDKGIVTISTMNRYVDRPLRGYDEVNIGEYAILSVSDDGPGISPDDLERIFEPFYTKKMMGRSGTGLGLAVVWNVLQDHSGYVDIKTNEDGTTFELYFPITRDKISDKGLQIPIKDYKGNGETVLVVDDIESQREVSCNMLETLGYEAKAVASGEEAVEYLKKHSVDLVLLDMIMDPGINGRETYKRIKKTHPNQKAIIVSGFAETDEVREAQKMGAGKYIKKPLTLKMVGLAVKEELEKP